MLSGSVGPPRAAPGVTTSSRGRRRTSMAAAMARPRAMRVRTVLSLTSRRSGHLLVGQALDVAQHNRFAVRVGDRRDGLVQNGSCRDDGRDAGDVTHVVGEGGRPAAPTECVDGLVAGDRVEPRGEPAPPLGRADALGHRDEDFLVHVVGVWLVEHERHDRRARQAEGVDGPQHEFEGRAVPFGRQRPPAGRAVQPAAPGHPGARPGPRAGRRSPRRPPGSAAPPGLRPRRSA